VEENFDDNFGRLNEEEKGEYLGTFESDDRLLVIYSDGNYEIADTEVTQRFDAEKVISIEKFDPEKIITAIYLDKEKLQFNVKRFKVETTTLRNKYSFIREGDGNYVEAVTTDNDPVVIISSGRGAQAKTQKIKLASFVEVMGWRAVGAKLFDYNKSVSMDWEVKKGKKTNQQELF
jgi:topoisomerase-4 subunit A